MNELSVAVLGATGAVGREMWRLLESSKLPLGSVLAYASARSAGTVLDFRKIRVTTRELNDETLESVQLVLASAGAMVSREWAMRFADLGAVVIDNSSAFRADPASPLVVPEVNGHHLDGTASIIANPNCSTIQMVMALAPLHREWGLRSIRVATYQAASGAGDRATRELLSSARSVLEERDEIAEVFPHPLGFNVIPQIGDFDDQGESLEESKMREESRRILELPDLRVSATCVRVPVLRGHSEAVWASFDKKPDLASVRSLLDRKGIVVQDDPGAGVYPVPREAAGCNEVFVGRIREDAAGPNGLSMWIVSDNLLKGAATNAIQIAETLHDRSLLPVSAAP